MNDLAAEFGDKLAILAFPCNQFGHQENGDGAEILANLKHVRPGNNYTPSFPVMEKTTVNGANTDPIFEYLKDALPVPSDAENANTLMKDPKSIIWAPVQRNDIAWNFEKFLIGKDGVPVKRYSRYFLTKDIAKDISDLI